ncbi:hypothetical protein [Hydrogenimonas urashimensis]|uniref:hypothetical protein n=1 Tax=Hydrogenimonas urashimensis TaxID=2740515 RepID=UPI001916B01B|nr:hypothetical protein [Hydrogenimonas urashimensis]
MAAWDVAFSRLRTYLKECRLHADRLRMAREKVASLLPMIPEDYENLAPEAIEHIDWLFYRFIKLQDTMGYKLFPQILVVVDDDIEWTSRPIIDILNRLEKYRYLPDAWEWRNLRGVRNMITHEYETVPEKAVETIQEAFDKSVYIIELFDAIETKLNEEELL